MLNSNRWNKSRDYFSYIYNLEADKTDDSMLNNFEMDSADYMNYSIFHVCGTCKFKTENETIEG